MDERDFIREKVSELLHIVSELENKFPEKKFTLDGHLFGSIGEVLAKYYYGVVLDKKGNAKKHDGIVDGKNVQIKITQRNEVDISSIPDNLIVLFLNKSDGEVYEVYNGPCEWLEDCKHNKNGWYTCSFSKLSEKDKEIDDGQRIEKKVDIKKWKK